MTAIPGKCHFDASGWLQGPVRIQHVMTPNRYSSGMAANPRGVVMHTEAGYEQGTVSTFMNVESQVSAFFSIGQDGSCHQYLPVGKGYVAWSQSAGNSTWRGIEDEDRTNPATPLTAAQVETFAQILEACSSFDGFPLQVTDSIAGTGLITHSAGGQAWGGHSGCPGPVRAAQRPVIVALARQVRTGLAEVTADGTVSLESYAAHAGTTPMHLLRLQVAHFGAFNQQLYAYGNGQGARTGWAAPVPAGTILAIP